MYVLATRHGQTNWNAENRIQGQKDVELNDTGREQAEAGNADRRFLQPPARLPCAI